MTWDKKDVEKRESWFPIICEEALESKIHDVSIETYRDLKKETTWEGKRDFWDSLSS